MEVLQKKVWSPSSSKKPQGRKKMRVFSIICIVSVGFVSLSARAHLGQVSGSQSASSHFSKKVPQKEDKGGKLAPIRIDHSFRENGKKDGPPTPGGFSQN